LSNRRFSNLLTVASALSALILGSWTTSADAVPWRSFGYPAQHVDHIGTKDDTDTAAFNLDCRNNSAGFILILRSNAGMKNVPFIFSVDGKTIDKGIANVSGVGGPTAWVSAAAPAAEALRWLNGIAGATHDVTISVKSVGTGVFTVEGAHNAAETAIDYCKLK